MCREAVVISNLVPELSLINGGSESVIDDGTSSLLTLFKNAIFDGVFLLIDYSSHIRYIRTSDSLNEGLPIKLTREKFQRK